MNATSPPVDQTSADLAGLLASIGCAIHCAAMPLVIGYLPMLGLSWLADPAFHRVMAVVCFTLALGAFLPGWRRHGSLTPTLFGLVGVGLLSLAAFGLESECCAACAAAKPPQQPVKSCGDSGCSACVAEDTRAEPTGAVAAASRFAWAVPFVTPIGGVLLIAAHVSNHRRSCACCDAGCSLDEARGVGPVASA